MPQWRALPQLKVLTCSTSTDAGTSGGHGSLWKWYSFPSSTYFSLDQFATDRMRDVLLHVFGTKSDWYAAVERVTANPVSVLADQYRLPIGDVTPSTAEVSYNLSCRDAVCNVCEDSDYRW